MSKQQKSSWQELKEKKYLSIPLAWIWMGIIFAIIGVIFLSFSDDGDLTQARNFILIVAALLALPLALERMIIADKQLNATQDQLRQSKKEAERAREEATKQQRDSNFEKWQSHLFSNNENLQRIAVNMLWNLAQKFPKDYHIQTMDNFHSLIRSIETITDEVPTNPRTIALKKLVNRGNIKTKEQKKVEADYEFRSNLQFLNFKNLDLSYSDLSNIDFRWTLWENVNVSHTDLTGATFEGCFLKNISFLETPTVENALWENVFIDVFEAETVYFPNHVRDAIAEKNLALEELVKWLERRRKAVKNASS